MKTGILFGLIFYSSACFSQSLKKEIDGIYNFKPSKVSEATRKKKSEELDKFWTKVTADTGQYLPQLRTEIATGNEHSAFFHYDGAALLISLSKIKSDRQLAAQSIAKCDLEDLSREAFVRMLNMLANDSIDVTAAALKILDDPKFSFFLVQHSLTFNQAYSLIYCLVPQNPRLYSESLVSKFKTATPDIQKTILFTLWFAHTCTGNELINSSVDNTALLAEVRDFAKQIKAHTALSGQESDYAKSISKEEFVQMRLNALKRFSDEALGELDLATKVFRINTPCQ